MSTVPNLEETRLQQLLRQRLTRALRHLAGLQSSDRRVFRTSEMTDAVRNLLIEQGYLTHVIRGWVMATDPRGDRGDSTQWYASFWQFCAAYCEERFGSDWYVSAEQSVLLHAENTTVPHQMVVFSPKGNNNNQPLPFQTSIFDSRERNSPQADDLTTRNGVRLFTLPAALMRIPESFFRERPIDAEVALGGLRDVSGLVGRLLDGVHSTVAGRLAGAFRHVGRIDVAEDILDAFKRLQLEIREENPFLTPPRAERVRGHVSPIVGRIRTLWEAGRQRVLDAFPPEPGLPADGAGYMAGVNDIYRFDAYHSLSIEGYRVTPELIERVASGDWNPEVDNDDRERHNALAARGYYLAFESAKQVVTQILGGAPAGSLMRRAHIGWYRSLFEPYVTAGLSKASGFSGYRNHPVYLRTSRYVPPQSDLIQDAMDALLDLLESEPSASVRAVMGHWIFGYIHPFHDGNGRTSRLLMNAMLASGGYPWTVIRVDDRDQYLHALDRASIDNDIGPFADFIAERLGWKPDPDETPGYQRKR